MRDTDENRIAHLGMIQTVIERMARNSFHLKGWSVTLVAALNALASGTSNVQFAYLSLFPPIVFAILDAYYLRQERLFRKLYDSVRTAPSGTLEGQMFSMDRKPYQKQVPSLLATLLSHSVAAFHGSVGAAVIVVIIVLHS